MTVEDNIDELYRLPLGEFTPARNALAKQLTGADATSVRKLEKPNIPAWAVNQLYWRDRRLYDQLIAAAERLRKTHHAMIEGKSVDLQKAETAHRDSVRAAASRIREILDEAGETPSPATLTAVNETLEALPAADEKAGRLTRPLKRMGFEALAGVVPGVARPRERNLKLVSSRRQKTPEKPEPSPAKKREIEALEEKLRTLRAEERQAQTEMEQVRRQLQRAEQDHARVEEELREAAEKVKTLRSDVARREKSQAAASAEREKLDEKLEKLTEA